MRWIVCVNQPFEGIIKHRVFKELGKNASTVSYILTDFHSFKILTFKEFWTFPEYVAGFFRDKKAYGILVDNSGDVSYSLDAGVTIVTDFFTEDFSMRWRDEIYYIEDLKIAYNEVAFVNALNKANVQAISCKNNHVGFCRKSPAAFQYGRVNKYSHIMTDSNEIIHGSEFKRIYVNTSPTLISLEDYTIFRIETN